MPIAPSIGAGGAQQAATFSIVYGRLLHQTLNRINNGRGPSNEDAPFELVAQASRGPRVQNFFASDGTAPDFNPRAATDVGRVETAACGG